MKKIKIFFIFIFSIIMILPMILFNWKPNYISEIDNRKLAEFPEITELNGNTFKEVFNYINDRIGFREEIIKGYTMLNDKVFNILLHPIYTYGQNDYVFFNLEQRNYNSHTQQFSDSIKKIKDYVESKGSKFYVLINPEKTSVYTQYLPKGVNYSREWIEKLEKELIDYDVNLIDNTEVLKIRSQTEQVYDKKYDAGHWNDIGAFYGANNLLSLIRKDYPNVNEHNKDDFEITESVQQYLPVSKFEVNETVPIYTLKAKYTDLTKDYNDEVKRDSRQRSFSFNQYTNSENNLRTLMFQGSYFNSRIKYLADRFYEFITVHNYHNIFDIDYYYNMFQPDIVVFEVTEYTINNTFFESNKMANMKLNSVLPPNIKYIEYENEIEYKENKGLSISVLEFDGIPDDAEYVYLKKDNITYDVKKIDGKYQLSVSNKIFPNKGITEVIFKKLEDNNYYRSNANKN